MKYRTAIIAAALVYQLTGCVHAVDIVLKNPVTGEIKECKTDSGPSFFPIAQTKIDNSASQSCAKGYEAAGWLRMN